MENRLKIASFHDISEPSLSEWDKNDYLLVVCPHVHPRFFFFFFRKIRVFAYLGICFKTTNMRYTYIYVCIKHVTVSEQ